MPDPSLANKLKLKPGQRAAIINPPEGYLEELGSLPAGVQISLSLNGSFDWVQVFVKSKHEVDALIPQVAKSLKPVSLLWVAFPKGSSKIQTDLTRDRGWDAIQALDLMWINLVSVNAVWSAFSFRPYKPGEPRQSFRLGS